MGRPWFEVLVVFGVTLGELKVFAGESPDVVDVRPPAEGDDSVRPAPRSRGSSWVARFPGCGRSRPSPSVQRCRRIRRSFRCRTPAAPHARGDHRRPPTAAPLRSTNSPAEVSGSFTAAPSGSGPRRRRHQTTWLDEFEGQVGGEMVEQLRAGREDGGFTAITYSSTRPGALASGPSVVGPHANKMSASPSSFFNAVSASARSPPITGRWSVAGQMREITTLRIPAPGRRRTHGTWD